MIETLVFDRTRATSTVLVACPKLRVLVITRSFRVPHGLVELSALRELDVGTGSIKHVQALCATAPGLRRLRLGRKFNAASGVGWPAMDRLCELDVGAVGDALDGLLGASASRLVRFTARQSDLNKLSEIVSRHAPLLDHLERIGFDGLRVRIWRNMKLLRDLPQSVRVVDVGCAHHRGGAPTSPDVHVKYEPPQFVLGIVQDMLMRDQWAQLDALNIALAPELNDPEWPGFRATQIAVGHIRAQCFARDIDLNITTSP